MKPDQCLKFFRVYADYRPRTEPSRFSYITIARDRREAVNAIQNWYSWLKVYDIRELTEYELREVHGDEWLLANLNVGTLMVWVPKGERE